MEPALTVHRARVAGWRATRGEVERWLEAVPVGVLGLAPDEIFYVPRLRVRVPPHRGTGPGGVPERIISELRALLATANSGWGTGFSPSRPYRFRTRPAWQAWLIRLWVEDRSEAAREAFRTSTGAPDLPRWQRSAVLRDGPALVAVTARLAEAGVAARWVATFDRTDFAIAYRAIEEAFGVRLDAIPEPLPPRTVKRRLMALATAAQRVLLHETAAALTARGNELRTLDPGARALLVAAATLARAPALPEARAPEFAAAVVAFAAHPETLAPVEHSAPPVPPIAEARASRDAVAPQAEPMEAPVAAPLPDQPEASARIVGQGGHAVEYMKARAEPEADTPAKPRIEASTEAPAEPTRTPIPPAIRAPDAAFTTGFGGLLFLLNAFAALGLYPDFTQPNGKRLAPSPLWLIDRIARRRFGARWRRDPLANWIAAHGSGGRLPCEWHAEPEWLHGFEAARPRHARAHGRLTLWHPAGFPLSDTPSPGPAGGSKRHPRLPAARSARWIACLTLYLDTRLRLWSPAGLGMLALKAQVEARDLELHASFALDAHPIELRLAGLDRNPGWQPAEGRAFAFAFA